MVDSEMMDHVYSEHCWTPSQGQCAVRLSFSSAMRGGRLEVTDPDFEVNGEFVGYSDICDLLGTSAVEDLIAEAVRRAGQEQERR